MRLGDLAGASETLDRALTVTESLNAPAEVAGVRCSQACLALELQDWDRARVHAGEAIETSGLAHTMRRTTPQWVLGMVSLLEGDLGSAGEQFQDALPRRKSGAHSVTRRPSAWVWPGKAAEGRTSEAASLCKRALDLWGTSATRWAWSSAWSCWRSSRREQSRKELRSCWVRPGRSGIVPAPRRHLVKRRRWQRYQGSLGQVLAAVGLEAGAKMDQTEAIAAAERIISRIETGNQ